MMAKERRAAFNARFPLDVDEWVEAQAAANERSKNAEVIFRLREAMAAEQANRPNGGASTAGQSLAA